MARVLALLAHPDDELFCAGTLARWAAEGGSVRTVYATSGQRGTLSSEVDPRELGSRREEEAMASAAVLGVVQVRFLGHLDGSLHQLAPGVLEEQFARHIREHRADTVVTFDPEIWDEHPDHRAVAVAASNAMQFARLPAFWPEHLEEGLETRVVTDRYLFAKTPSVQRHRSLIDITDTMDRKISAFLAHESQVEFLIDELLLMLRAASVDADALPFDLSNKERRPGLVEWAFKHEAKKAARLNPLVRYGERFHHQGLPPLLEGIVAAATRLAPLIHIGRRLRGILSPAQEVDS